MFCLVWLLGWLWCLISFCFYVVCLYCWLAMWLSDWLCACVCLCVCVILVICLLFVGCYLFWFCDMSCWLVGTLLLLMLVNSVVCWLRWLLLELTRWFAWTLFVNYCTWLWFRMFASLVFRLVVVYVCCCLCLFGLVMTALGMVFCTYLLAMFVFGVLLVIWLCLILMCVIVYLF